jgi:AcrR family transcriptional regulator
VVQPEDSSRRAKKKAEVRRALVSAADRLFTDYGFDATTIDDIAEAAGVSRRTFFRYFETKEAIVFPQTHTRFEMFKELLHARLEEEPPFEAVRESIFAVARHFMESRDSEVRRQDLVDASPSLLATELRIYQRWEIAIAEAAAPRGASAARKRRATLFAAATMGIVRAVLRQWFRAKGRKNLVALGREAFQALEDGFADFRG